MTFPDATLDRAARLLELCRAAQLRVAAVESCTGGLIAACLTEVAGASAVFDRGYVVYSNEAKREALGVPAGLLARFGAVSGEVARAMATGALSRSRADLAVSVTGIAGPGGSTPGKPVGLVYHACAGRDGALSDRHAVYAGDRAAIRLATVDAALDMLREAAAAL